MEETTSFTAEQAAAANRGLRAALGLGPQAFSTEQFVGMISEEIGALRDAGKSDEEIAGVLEREAGVRVSPDALRRYDRDGGARGGSS